MPKPPKKIDAVEGLIRIEGSPVYWGPDGTYTLKVTLFGEFASYIPIEDVIAHNEWVRGFRSIEKPRMTRRVQESFGGIDCDAKTRETIHFESDRKLQTGDTFTLASIDYEYTPEGLNVTRTFERIPDDGKTNHQTN